MPELTIEAASEISKAIELLESFDYVIYEDREDAIEGEKYAVIEHLKCDGYCVESDRDLIKEYLETKDFTVIEDDEMKDKCIEYCRDNYVMTVEDETEAYEVCANYDIYTPEYNLSLGEIFTGVKL